MIPTSTISRSVQIGLNVIGCWPDSSLTSFCRFFWTSSIMTMQTFQYWYFIIHFGTEDLMLLMDGLSVTVAYSVTMVKLVCLWLNSGVFYDMIAEMAKDWKECSMDSSRRTMIKKANLSHRCSNITIGLYSLAVLFYGIGGIASRLQYDASSDQDLPPRELFFKMHVPFEINKSPTYELIYATQFFHQFSVSSIYGMLNGLILTLILHLGGQIDIMCRALKDISSTTNQGESLNSTITTLINRHRKIITFSDNIEDTFSQIALWQFLSNTLIMCTLGYQIVTAIGTNDWIATVIKAVLFYAVISMEAFTYCFAGEYLGDKSKAISDAVYESLWYNLRPNETRMLLLVIIRSQRRLTLTIGKFTDLSLERFTTIMKASASYISVLHAMH